MINSQPPAVVARGFSRASSDAELKLRATGVTALFFLLLGHVAAPAQQPASVAADLVLLNGKIVTLEENAPQVEAVAIGGNRIAALGSSAEMKRHIGEKTQVIDVAGALVIPGFVESHGHFNGVGLAQLNLNLMKAKSWDEIVAQVEQAVKKAKPGEWIYGRGWHQEKWNVKPAPEVEGFPIHESLSRVSPDNPVLLTHASGHATFANAKAMELSGVTRTTPNPPGGDFLRDASGNPTGLFRETASRLIRTGAGESPRTPEEETARARRILELASQEAVSKGVTTFQDAGSGFATVDLLKKMIDEGRINVRLWIMLNANNEALAANLENYRTIDYNDGFLTVRAIKRQIDGALGPRGAWLLEPYSDKPDDIGRNTTPLADIRETAKLAMKYGYQLCVHAIGDRANRETLNIFEEAFKANPDKKDVRWRVEHAQHLASSRHPALRQARGHRVHAGGARDVGCALCARAAWRQTRARGRLRLAEADEIRRSRDERHRRPGGGPRPDRRLLRDREPEDEGRDRVQRRRANEPHGSAQVVHDQWGLRRVRGRHPRHAQTWQVRGPGGVVEGYPHHS